MEISRLESVNLEFRNFEKSLQDIIYPNNEVNKVMGLIMGNIDSLELIQTRYEQSRLLLKKVSNDDVKLRQDNPEARVLPVHPFNNYANASIRVDVESVFIFGLTLINKIILLLRFYFPDVKVLDRKKNDQYANISKLYKWFCDNSLSPLAEKFKTVAFNEIKWLYAVLRFYRNEFIEHLDRGYQQGMGWNSRTVENFRLHSFGWETGSPTYDLEITDFKKKVVARGLILSPEFNPRHYVQLLFDNVVAIPDDLLEEALKIIEKNGVETPTVSILMGHISNFVTITFNFLANEIVTSELEQYRKI